MSEMKQLCWQRNHWSKAINCNMQAQHVLKDSSAANVQPKFNSNYTFCSNTSIWSAQVTDNTISLATEPKHCTHLLPKSLFSVVPISKDISFNILRHLLHPSDLRVKPGFSDQLPLAQLHKNWSSLLCSSFPHHLCWGQLFFDNYFQLLTTYTLPTMRQLKYYLFIPLLFKTLNQTRPLI
jgi:hypothetical protein